MMIITKMILNLMGEVEKIPSFLKGGSTKMNLELNRRKRLKFMLRLDVFPLVSLQALSYTLYSRDLYFDKSMLFDSLG